MLTERDIGHITERFHEVPSEKVCNEALELCNQFTDLSSIAMLCAGISLVAIDTKDLYYRQLSKALFDLGIENGLDIYDLMPWHVPKDGARNNIYTVKKVSQKVALLKDTGLETGFLHGHYRILTPANFLNVLIAKERCDHLVLGLEDGWRTEYCKGANPLVRDCIRWKWFLASGLDCSICRISRFDYSDEGYERILRTINPDIYFVNESLSEEDQKRMIERAGNNGINTTILPEQEGFHTSEYFDLMLQTSNRGA